MMDYKSTTTPMASNLNLLSDASSEAVDATIIRENLRSTMGLLRDVLQKYKIY